MMEKQPRSQKQRKIDDLTRQQRRAFLSMKRDARACFDAMSYINSGVKKSDLKKKGGELGAPGIHSVSTYDGYISKVDTFLKYCLKTHNVTSLGGIKPRMVDEYLEGLIARDLSPKTVKIHLNALLKLQEGGKERKIVSLSKIVKQPIREKVAGVKYRKEDYRRSGGNGGYSLEEAKIIERKMSFLYGEYETLMVRVFWEAGPRIAEFRRIKFEDIKEGGYTGYNIELFHPNQNKNDRPRRVAISSDTYERLMDLWAYMAEHGEIRPGQNIWGKFSEYQIRARVKKAANARVKKEDGTQVGRYVQYSGIHDFRKATISYYDAQLINQKERWTKEALADAILWHVNFTLKDKDGKVIKKDGRDWYPLNPVVSKYRYSTVDGIEIKTQILTAKGKKKKDRRFVKDELMDLDTRVLRNLLETQVLGHNRPNVVGEAYRTKKNPNWNKMKLVNPPKRSKKPKS